MQTIDELIRQRDGDHRTGLLFADRTWTHDQVVRARPTGPPSWRRSGSPDRSTWPC